MKLKKALEVANSTPDAKLLIPVKMGFFVMVRPASSSSFPTPSIPEHLKAHRPWLPDTDFECRPVEVTCDGWRPLKEVQGRWIQWAVDEKDLERDTFMVV